MKTKSLLLAILTALMFVASGAAADTHSKSAGPAHREYSRAREGAPTYNAGTYWTTVISNVVYVPTKVVLATAGLATSGVAYIVTLGNEEVTRSIFDPTVGGDYFVTPAMVEGEQRVRFMG